MCKTILGQLSSMRFFSAALKGLTFLTLGSSVFAAPSNQKRQNDTDAGADGHWVPTWVSMPQLVEPNNLPPAPFVGFPARSKLS